jgi:hypothetical protein
MTIYIVIVKSLGFLVYPISLGSVLGNVNQSRLYYIRILTLDIVFCVLNIPFHSIHPTILCLHHV